MSHSVKASPETVHWGYFDARLEPVLTIESGEIVTIETVSGHGDTLPGEGFKIAPSLLEIGKSSIKRSLPGHICTGPVAVKGAKPGQVLQVDILEIELGFDWGFTGVRPMRGAIPYGFEREVFFSRIDRQKRIAHTPWGKDVELAPFFGVLGVAPPQSWGQISTIQPRYHGGNIDNRELVAGTTLYLPIFVEDALFSAGDGHAAQGDGEICVNAIETGLNGKFRLTIRDDFSLEWPMAETRQHLITMAFDPSLDVCATSAITQMVDAVTTRMGIRRSEAYAFCSMVSDLRITQVVNDNKGVHCMFPKQYF